MDPRENSATKQMLPKELDNYLFPQTKLRRIMIDETKEPDYAKYNTNYEIIGGYLSPVSDAYRKAGLVPSIHRIQMIKLAVEDSWMDVDDWEGIQKEARLPTSPNCAIFGLLTKPLAFTSIRCTSYYQPTAVVLDHFEREINDVLGGVATASGERKQVRVVLLAGADLIQTMSVKDVWSQEDLNHILGKYGAFIVERLGTDIDDALAALQQWRDNIHVIPQLIQNDVSSTKIRLFVKRQMTIRYLVPAPVVDVG
ncbi:MAG: hypothetical protein Q9167_005107 [Letrouitia subvulpina]